MGKLLLPILLLLAAGMASGETGTFSPNVWSREAADYALPSGGDPFYDALADNDMQVWLCRSQNIMSAARVSRDFSVIIGEAVTLNRERSGHLWAEVNGKVVDVTCPLCNRIEKYRIEIRDLQVLDATKLGGIDRKYLSSLLERIDRRGRQKQATAGP